MARFLSSAWIEEFNRAVADVELAAPGSSSGLAVRDGRFSMCQIVTDGPEGEVRTTLRVHDGRLTMALGDAEGADVTIRLTWADALAMAAGALASTDAIAAGRVRVRGDLSVLAEAQATLEAVSPHLVAVRAATGY